MLWCLPLWVKFVCGNANSWGREVKHQCSQKTLYLCPLSHCALVERDSCQGTIKTNRLRWWLLKITNGDSRKALQAFTLSSATRPGVRFHGHQRLRVLGATNGLSNLSRLHLFLAACIQLGPKVIKASWTMEWILTLFQNPEPKNKQICFNISYDERETEYALMKCKGLQGFQPLSGPSTSLLTGCIWALFCKHKTQSDHWL